MARILVADDDILVRETIALILRRSGHDVSAASDGNEAIAKIDRYSFDLLIADLIMPEIDGIGLVLALRQSHRNVRVLCISGGGRDGQMQYLDFARKLGAHSVLAKPFTPKELETAVETVLHLPDSVVENDDGREA